jgi:hypothetical protein
VSPVELLLAGRVAVGGVPAAEVLAGFVAQPFDRRLVESGRRGYVLEGAAGGESSADLVAEGLAPVDGFERRVPHGLELFELTLRQFFEH